MLIVRFSDGGTMEMTAEEYENAKREAALLIIAAVKNGYGREEAEEMYGISVIGENTEN